MRQLLKSTFKIAKMDCSSEEQQVRLKIEPVSEVQHLDFDLPGRKLTVYHIAHVIDI